MRHPKTAECKNTDETKEAKRGFTKLAVIVIVFTLALILRKYVIDIATVVGPSMEETFYNGDVLLVDVGVEKIERYDVITLRNDERKLIKRVIGLPGETIRIAGGEIYINEEILPEQQGVYTEYAGVADEEYVIKEDEYFVMGDNRAESYDSRDFGGVNKEDIIGKVTVSLYPFNKKFQLNQSQR